MDRRRVVGIALGALAGAAYGTGPLFFKAYVYPAGVGWIADRWGWGAVFGTMVVCCVLTILFSALTLGHKAQIAARAE